MSTSLHLSEDDADFLAYLVAVGTKNRHDIDAEPDFIPVVADLIDRHDRVISVYPDAREIGGYGFLTIKTNKSGGESNTALLCDDPTKVTTFLAMLGDLREETMERIANWRSQGLTDQEVDETLTAGILAGTESCDGATVETMLRVSALLDEPLSATGEAN